MRTGLVKKSGILWAYFKMAIFQSLCSFGDSTLPCDLSSLIDIRRVIDFFSLLFTKSLLRMGLLPFKLLICQIDPGVSVGR